MLNPISFSREAGDRRKRKSWAMPWRWGSNSKERQHSYEPPRSPRSHVAGGVVTQPRVPDPTLRSHGDWAGSSSVFFHGADGVPRTTPSLRPGGPVTDRNRSRVLPTGGVRGVMPRSQRAIPRKRGDEKMGKKMRCRTRHQDAAETRTALGGWRAGARLASKGPSWSKEMCFWRPWGSRPWNMGAGAMTMSGQRQPRSGQLSAWSQRDVLVAGPPTQKKAPAVIFSSDFPPPAIIFHSSLTIF